MKRKTTLSEQQINYIQKRYNEGIGCPTIAKELGIHSSRIYKYVKMFMKPRDDKHKGFKYSFNEQYFDHIDSEEKAYWLGFIYADGYLTSSKQQSKALGISLCGQDIGHLEKFKKCVQFEGNIYSYTTTSSGYKKGSPYCRITLKSDHMYESLVKYGVVEHKTNILVYGEEVKKLPMELQRHFIRGYIDGNGSIAITKGKHFQLKICATPDMLQYIKYFFTKNGVCTSAKPYKRHDYDIVQQLDIGGNNLLYKALILIYDKATIFLDRKYQRYLAFLDLYNSRSASKDTD